MALPVHIWTLTSNIDIHVRMKYCRHSNNELVLSCKHNSLSFSGSHSIHTRMYCLIHTRMYCLIHTRMYCTYTHAHVLYLYTCTCTVLIHMRMYCLIHTRMYCTYTHAHVLYLYTCTCTVLYTRACTVHVHFVLCPLVSDIL